MKNRRLKGFTLVEILIVIVIIGILIGALVPRMSAAQGRARDVARKNDLAQLQSAILVSFQDKGVYPCQNVSGSTNPYGCESDTSAASGLDISAIQNLLLSAGMNSIPQDPLKGNIVTGIGSSTPTAGEYRYVLTKSNDVANGGFVLMARTEVEGGSNRVVCGDGSGTGSINSSDDTKDLQLCSSLTKGDACTNDRSGTCTYQNEGELRYILMY